MFSRLVLAGLMFMSALPSSACTALFELTTDDGHEYVLSPATQSVGGVYVDANGANDLDLDQVIELSCPNGAYVVPVVTAYIETGVSSATRSEYFVYETEKATLTPVKSMLSMRTVDRETGEVITEPSISIENGIRHQQLCDAIAGDNAFDQPIWPVKPVR